MRKINVSGAKCRIGSRQHQFTRQGKSVFVGAGKHERSRIGKYRSVKAGGDLRRDGDPGLTSQAKNHFAGCTRCGINPVDMCERTTAYVMVDADQEALFETFEPGALAAVTLPNNGCFILPVDVVCLNHGVSKRKWPVDPRHSVAERDLGLLAHGAEHA